MDYERGLNKINPLKMLILNTKDEVKDKLKNNILRSFIWDSQELNVHFELKPIKKIDLKIGSKGYSDIKNAVFFEVQDNEGYLYQYDKKGVSYICKDK